MKNRIYKNIIPNVDDTLKLLSVLGVTVEDFYEVQNLFPAKEMSATNYLGELSSEEKIPVYDQVFSCGYGQFVPDTEVVDNYSRPGGVEGKKIFRSPCRQQNTRRFHVAQAYFQF